MLIAVTCAGELLRGNEIESGPGLLRKALHLLDGISAGSACDHQHNSEAIVAGQELPTS